MDDSWLAVTEAASVLGVSAVQVRRLIRTGELAAQQRAGLWFLDPADVQRRRLAAPGPGRPLSATNAWLLLRLLNAASVPVPEGDPVLLSRLQRHRLGALLADLPPAAQVGRLLHARARWERVRVHPGVLERLLSDERVRVGGARAAAGNGGGVAAGGRPVIYVADSDMDALRSAYHLVADPAGNVTLGLLDGRAAELVAALAPGGGLLPLAVAWADLLEDLDPRARHAAHEWVDALPRPLPVTDLVSSGGRS